MEPAAHRHAHATNQKKARVPGLRNTRGSIWLPLTLQHCNGASKGLFLLEQLAMAAPLALFKLQTGSTKWNSTARLDQSRAEPTAAAGTESAGCFRASLFYRLFACVPSFFACARYLRAPRLAHERTDASVRM